MGLHGGELPGACVRDHGVGRVPELVEHQAPGRPVRLRERPDQSQFSGWDRQVQAVPLVWVVPCDFGGHQDTEALVAAGPSDALVIAAVDGHVVDEQHLGTHQRFPCRDELVESRTLSHRAFAQLRLDGLPDDGAERLAPVGGDVPDVLRLD